MSNQHRHIIQKLALEVQCSDPDRGRTLHDQLGDTLLEKVLPELELLFDGLGDIRLERLELDLGTLPANNWEATLREQVLKQCREKLYPGIGKNGERPLTNDENQTTPSRTANGVQAYLHFLKTGRLPWWAEHYSLPALEQQILAGPKTKISLEALSTIVRMLRANPLALKRLIRQSSLTFLRAIWKEIKPKGISAQAFLKGRFHSLVSDYFSGTYANQISREAFFSAALNISAATDERPFQAAVARELLDLLTENVQVPAALTEQLQALYSRAGSPKKGSPGSDQSQPEKENKATTAKPVPPLAETVYVANAGLVLLYPFLKNFFDTLNLLENKSFRGVLEKELAVQWLHFLATGSRECPEPELTLPKILCGMAPEVPVGRMLEPQATEVQEAEALLATLIRHWTALKNTSPDNLRGGFLNRSGKLETLADGAWKLTVERQPQDVLLEQLPWGIGIVRLPWMDAMMYVEW